MKRFGSILNFVVLAICLSLTLTVAAQSEPVTLNVWVFEGENEFLPTVIAAFQAEYPNITVQITDIPEDEYITKIDTALLANQPPDLGYIYERRWVISGKFLSLDDIIAAQNINLADYNAGALDACMVDSQVYCIGTYTGAVLLFYNKDMFDAAGIEYPSPTEPMTIDEYAEIAQKLSVPSENIEERVWGSDAWATYWWMDIRNFFSEDGRTAVGYVNDEATTHTHQVIADMRAQGNAITSSESDQVAGLDLLASGKLATSITDNVVAVSQLEAAGFRWGAAVSPVEAAGDLPYVPVWSDGLGVFSQSAHPEEAKLFAAFLGTVGNELRIDVTGDLPLNMTMAAEWVGESEGRQEVLAAVQTARPALFIPNYFGVMDPVVEAFDGLMLEDGLSAQEAFDEVAPIIQENLDEAWETWDQIQ